MKNLSVPKKLTVSSTPAVILFNVMIACTVMFGMKSIANSLNSFYREPYQTVTASGGLNKSLNAQQKYLLVYLINDDQDSIIGYQSELRRLNLAMQSDIVILKSNLTLQKNQDKPNLLIANLTTLRRLSGQLQNMCNRGGVKSAKKLYYSDFIIITNASQALSSTLSSSSKPVANRFYISASKTEKQAYQIIAVFSAAILVFIVLVCIYIVCIITKPTKQIESAMLRFSEGELDVDIPYVSKDELGVLAEDIRTASGNLKTYIDNISYMLGTISKGSMTVTVDVDYGNDFAPIKEVLVSIVGSLNSTLSQVQVAASRVSTGAEQVSLGAQTLSQGAIEQASSVEGLVATISEISDKVKANSSNAQTVSSHADEAARVAQDGDTLVQQLVESMSETKKTSTKINKIIKTINNIAFQTNVPALNAAVEAARAGSAEQGFSIVAEGVRDLASKSAQVTDNTTFPAENTLPTIQNNTTLVDKVRKSLDAIAKRSSDVTVLIRDITISSQEQTGAIDQVNEGVNLISGVIQTNSATAEESATANEELSSQSEIVLSLVSVFQLRERATVEPMQISDLPEDPGYSDSSLFSDKPDLFSEEESAELAPLL